MAKTTAPLLSFGARGQIGKAMVMSSWRGVDYARQLVIPANPRTTDQQTTRTIFRTLSEMWTIAPPLLRAPWNLNTQGRPLTDRNLFIGRNIQVSREAEDWEDFVGSPGAKGGLPHQNAALTPSDGTITVAFTNPPPPSGWTLVNAIAVAFKNQSPQAPFGQEFHAAEDDDDPTEVVLTGLTNSEEYVVSSWLLWTKQDGRPAYGPSLVGTATPAS